MVDRKLLEAHQWVVDESEKKPGWWAEQAICAVTVVDIVARVLTWKGGWDAVFLFGTLAVGGLLVFASRHEPMLKRFGTSTWVRPFLLGCTAFQICTLVMKMNGVDALHLISSVLLLSFYYFAACENPRPKKRKQKLVLNPV